ncbi:hypothetical protein RJ639_031324 [Escallonia herrerae]|uniref:Uncharacterized protein n=1 Tax=Escallonia herrerae TaxID=1293975 RepID=A0AA88WX55_9ASTE|nr:hypothetical protein RJ639_031324 [Escallonia herrerae]
MDSFFGNKIKESFFGGEDDKEKPTTTTADHPTSTTGHHAEPTNSELFSSAKLVAEAVRSTFRRESDKVDKAKVADAAEDLLQAASKYGKLDEKGFGRYVDKAEGYLHSYHSKTTATTTGSGESATTTTTTESDHLVAAAPKPSEHSGGEEAKSGSGGYGEYMKMAEGLFKR